MTLNNNQTSVKLGAVRVSFFIRNHEFFMTKDNKRLVVAGNKNFVVRRKNNG